LRLAILAVRVRLWQSGGQAGACRGEYGPFGNNFLIFLVIFRKVLMMNKKLAWGLGVGLFLLAGRPAIALAPAGMEVGSDLNQPLDASIVILNASPEALASLKVRQAEPAAMPLDLHFRIGRDDAGRDVVRVTTPEPVREPALNFVLEFEWASGRLRREYSILLDPQ